jgi:hypothetical protein
MVLFNNRHVAIIVALLFLYSEANCGELIRNGNFEKGNKDFRSDYRGGLGSYLVTKNLRNFHQKQSGNVGFFGDHTTGRGHMLAVDGETTGGKFVWEQKVNVLPNQEYVFSMWVASWSPDSPAKLEVAINGREMGSVDAPSKLGEWRRLQVKWNSELDTVAVIAIQDRNTSGEGNDFVIDDISLQGTRPFPPQVDSLVNQYEKDATTIREKAKTDLQKRQQRLVADLNLLLEALTKEGKLDEALVLRQQISVMKEEFAEEANP